MSRIEELLPITSAKFRADFPKLYLDAFIYASVLCEPPEEEEKLGKDAGVVFEEKGEGYIKTALLKEYSRYLRDTLAERGLISSDASIQSILEDYRFYVEEEVEKIYRNYSTKRAWDCLGVAFYLIRTSGIYLVSENIMRSWGSTFYIDKILVPTIPVGEKLVPRAYLLEKIRVPFGYVITVSEIDREKESPDEELLPVVDAMSVFVDDDIDTDMLNEDEKELVACVLCWFINICIQNSDWGCMYKLGRNITTRRSGEEGESFLAEFISRYLPEEDREEILRRYTIEILGNINF